MRTLIIGGARSGKSAYAERLAVASRKRIVYIATAQAGDDEMRIRIAHHRERRDVYWTTVEETIELGRAIEKHSGPETLILVDCLTIWLANLLFSEARSYPEVGKIDPPAAFQYQRALLLQALENAKGGVVLVSNEIGQGVIPQGAISRWFVDESGRLNQDVAAVCDRAVLIVAGLPVALKG